MQFSQDTVVDPASRLSHNLRPLYLLLPSGPWMLGKSNTAIPASVVIIVDGWTFPVMGR